MSDPDGYRFLPHAPSCQCADCLWSKAPGVRIDCWCRSCEDTVTEALVMNGDRYAGLSRFFIVCPICGNKRCPRAAHHDNPCSGSNEPGQVGSVYGVMP